MFDAPAITTWQSAHERTIMRDTRSKEQVEADVDAAMAERVRLFHEARAQQTWPLEIDGGDADALIRMMQAARVKAIENGECGPWFDDMIARIRAAVPEGDGRDE